MRAKPDFEKERVRMVEQQLRSRGIGDERVLAAMSEVPRERFVPERLRRRAYRDGALPIGADQTISQPWIVAAICQGLGLTGDERVLEIGTGSGYSTAVLARLAAQIISIERIEDLGVAADRRLTELGIENFEVTIGDGSQGDPDRAPFDAIAVHAAAPRPPRALLSQLEVGGRLVAPIAFNEGEQLTVLTRVSEDFDPHSGAGLHSVSLGLCRFVPLIGREGFRVDL